MHTRWMLLTAGLAWAACGSPEIAFGQPGLPAVPPLPLELSPALPTEPPTIPSDAPSVEMLLSPVLSSVVLDAGPSSSILSSVHPVEPSDMPQIVRPRYGSVLTNGAYMPDRVPRRPAGTAHWQPGGREGRVGSPYYYSAPGQEGPLYTVHERRGVPWGYNHSAFEYHFGPGYYRNAEAGHYRFPYYTYRAPWYSPGPPIYNRFTNLPW